MADSGDVRNTPADGADVEMETGEEVVETVAPEGDDAENGEATEENTEAEVPVRTGFIE